MPPDLVIFDCDGVLIDSELLSGQVLIAEAALYGVPLTPAYVRDHFLGRSFPTVAQVIRERFAVTLPPDFEARYRASLLELFENALQPTPGLTDLLDRLRPPKCVATSSSPPRVARSLAITGLDHYFPRVFTASQVARGKPAPDLFLFVADQMGVDPARCLVIEDSRPGISAAQAAGMPVLLYTGGSHMAGLGFDTSPPVRSVNSWTAFADLYPHLFKDQTSQ